MIREENDRMKRRRSETHWYIVMRFFSISGRRAAAARPFCLLCGRIITVIMPPSLSGENAEKNSNYITALEGHRTATLRDHFAVKVTEEARPATMAVLHIIKVNEGLSSSKSIKKHQMMLYSQFSEFTHWLCVRNRS